MSWRALMLVLAVASQVSAANPPPLFTEILDASADAPPRVLSKFPVKVNFAALDANSDSFFLPLPASAVGNYTAERVRFEARAGGGYHWIGKTAEHDVVLTVDGDWITGFIRGGPDTYSIMSSREAGIYTYSMSRMDVDEFPPDLVEDDEALLKAVGPKVGSNLKANLAEYPQAQCFGAPDEPIDVLVVYSPEALAAAGGDVGLLTNQLANAEAGANTTLANSSVPATIRIVAVEPAPSGLPEVGTEADLIAARQHLGLRSRRQLLKADIVVYLTSKLVNEGSTYCGMTRAQRRSGDQYFGMGYDFYDSAVLVLTHQCGIQNNDLSHEIGHIVGLDHNPQSTTALQEESIFPFAYGHYVNFFFRDDMSSRKYCSNGCDRQMFFSDPAMSYLGYPRGTAFRNNAETYRRMYRCTNTLADFIFVDNFE